MQGQGGTGRGTPPIHWVQPIMLHSLQEVLGVNIILGATRVMGSTWLERERSKKEEFKSLGPLWVEQGRGELRVSPAGKGVGIENERERLRGPQCGSGRGMYG